MLQTVNTPDPPRRPMTAPLADAALLAAGAPEGGALDPTDESVEAAFLDLRGDRPNVAISKLKSVGAAFGPSLYVQERLRLIVACGDIPPSRAAAALFESPMEGGLRVAAIRGEDLLGRLEELMLAGCDLGKPPLRDESRLPVAAWAPASASVVVEALAAGSRVVVGRFITPEDAARAIASDASGERLSEPPARDVLLQFLQGYGLDIRVPCSLWQLGKLRDFAERLMPSNDGGVEVGHGELEIGASSRTLDYLQDIARRLELAAPAGSLKETLSSRIEAIIEERHSEVPAELLEFGYDVRPGSEWLEG